jgi:glycosyltransferase involved in cell wall biosynthesis
MKILFFVEFYFPSIGGAQEVVRQIAERMAAKGHEVTVATTKISTRSSLQYQGVNIIEFEVSGNLVRGMRGDLDGYQSFLLQQEFDLVFFYAAQQWTFDASWKVLDRISGKKVLVPCGYSGLHDPAYKEYFSEIGGILAKMDAVVYHARDYRDYKFADSLGLTNGTLIPNGADLEEFEKTKDSDFRLRHGAKDSTFVIITVGTMTGMKGHLELAQAYAAANFGDRDTLLILNGNHPNAGGERPSVLSQFTALVRGYGMFYATRHAVKMGLIALGFRIGKSNTIERVVADISRQKGKKVILADLPRPDLVQAYLQADLFVFASNIEYSPLVLFESAAAGLPFLTVPVGNAREIIEWTGGGEVCAAPIDAHGYTRVNPKELASHIESLAMDEAARKEMGERGKEAVRNRFNWAHLANEYELLFVRLVTEETVTYE